MQSQFRLSQWIQARRFSSQGWQLPGKICRGWCPSQVFIRIEVDAFFLTNQVRLTVLPIRGVLDSWAIDTRRPISSLLAVLVMGRSQNLRTG